MYLYGLHIYSPYYIHQMYNNALFQFEYTVIDEDYSN